MRKEPTNLDFDEFVDELRAEGNPRALVILASSKIDALLRDVLAKFFLDKAAKAKEPDELLDGDGPLSTYSSRIKSCRRLGLIDESFAKLLDRVRDLRNQAAHWISFTPSNSPIRDQFANLCGEVEKRTSYGLTVETYWGKEPLNEQSQRIQAILLTVCVILESISRKVERVRENPKFISASTD